MSLAPPPQPDPVNRTFLLGTIRTLSFGGDTPVLCRRLRSACGGVPVGIQPAIEGAEFGIILPHPGNVYMVSGVLEPAVHGGYFRARLRLEIAPWDLLVLNVAAGNAREDLGQLRHRQFIAGQFQGLRPLAGLLESHRGDTAD